MQAFFLDYWWLGPVAVAGFLAYRFMGWRGLLAVVTLGALGGIYTKGKQDERADNEREQTERDRVARETRTNVENDIAKTSPDAKRERLSRWMRDR